MYNTNYSDYYIQPDPASLLQRDMAPFFTVFDTTVDWPQPKQIRFRGQFVLDPADCFDELRQRFEWHGFTPIIREEDDGQIALIALPVRLRSARLPLDCQPAPLCSHRLFHPLHRGYLRNGRFRTGAARDMARLAV
jgi:hypothetical protein